MASARECRRFIALQDHVVAMLQRQMQMRHEARLIGDHIHQMPIGLYAVDRREPQPADLGICFSSVFARRPSDG